MTPEKITKTTLSNGMLVMLKEIHTAPIISHWVWYRVGSRNETPGRTGISHWVEHMQFKGTPQFPSGVLDKAISREGGYWNAFTYLDWTTYFETMPASRIDLALSLEADRMVNSVIDPAEVESERTVILSERQGNENEPLFLLSEKIQAAAFATHPYRFEVIGERADLETMTRTDLYQHYRDFYNPANSVIALAGDFDSDQMLARIRELYETRTVQPDSSRQPAGAAQIVEPPWSQAIRTQVEGPGETAYVQLAYRAPAAAHPDFFPLTTVDSLLTGPSSLNMFGGGLSNKTSRLYRALVETELAVSVYGGLQATIDPYLYTITAIVHPNSRPEDVIAAIDAEIEKARTAPPDPTDLKRADKQARALFAYGSESITNQAFWLGFSEMFAGYEWFENYLARLQAVSPEQAHQVARQYLNPDQRVIGVYIPTGESA